MALDQRQGPYPVADQRRSLEIQRFRSALHLHCQPLLHVVASAGKKNARLLDQCRIILPADAAHARSAAALDLVEQTRARADREDAVAARPQQKSLLQGHQGAIDRAGRGEWAEIAAVLGPGAAILGQLGKIVTGGQMNERKRFIVPQQNIVARHQPLDQVALEQQRLCLGMGADDLHGGGFGNHAPQPVGQPRWMRVVLHPALQVARLADIDRFPLRSSIRYTPGVAGMLRSASRITAMPAAIPAARAAGSFEAAVS